jgi:hypothetical protein
MVTGAIREGAWECPFCTTVVLGRSEDCPSCGAGRPGDVRFFLPEGAARVTDAARLEDAASGPDWTCSHCGTDNPSRAEAGRGSRLSGCLSCGNARDAEDRSRRRRSYARGAAPRSAMSARVMSREEIRAAVPGRRASPAAPATSAPPKSVSARLKRLFLATLVALLLAVTAAFLFQTEDHEGVAEGFTWERTIEVEALRTFREEGWSAPSGARVIAAERRLRIPAVPPSPASGGETYACGQTDLGNGYFQDRICRTPIVPAEPGRPEVRDDWLSWEIDRWVVARTLTRDGEDRRPEWPRFSMGPDEREGGRREAYAILAREEVEGPRDLVRVSASRRDWDAIEAGQRISWTSSRAFGAWLAAPK